MEEERGLRREGIAKSLPGTFEILICSCENDCGCMELLNMAKKGGRINEKELGC